MTDDGRGFASVPDAVRVDRSDVLASGAGQLPQDVLLQPFGPLGGNLRVSRVCRGPHDVTAFPSAVLGIPAKAATAQSAKATIGNLFTALSLYRSPLHPMKTFIVLHVLRDDDSLLLAKLRRLAPKRQCRRG
jgi:hypothetical protein